MSNQFVLLKNRGLYTFPNDLSENPPGAFIQADNVVIDRESVVEPRRGFAKFGEQFSTNSQERARQIIEYKNRIILHHGIPVVGSTLSYDSTGNGDFLPYSTSVQSVDEYRLKTIESNGNLYLLTTDGTKKLSVETADQLGVAEIVDAGAPQALSLNGTLINPGTIILNNRIVAYRVVWGYTDFNGNLILGAPSGLFTIINNTGGTRNVELTFSIPKAILNSPIKDRFFYQLYRTPQFDSTVTNPTAGDDLNLVFEDFVPATGTSITIEDVYPDDLRQGSLPLYTNANSGEGIVNANNTPPFAKDIALFQGYTFYANTSTVQRKSFTLLSGDSTILDGETITISDGVNPAQTYTFKSSGPFGPTDVEISSSLSDGIRIYETANNLVNAINNNPNELTVYAYYDSLDTELPGRIRLEQQETTGAAFSVMPSPNIGDQFDPTIQSIAINNISVANPTIVTSATNHGLISGQTIRIHGSNSTPSIDGDYVVTVISPTTFSIPVDVTSAGTTGYFMAKADLSLSTNEARANRIYYSKFQQPEAVPLGYFFDVGPRDKAIMRIVALRDSLFVFKEDGIYRVSGTVAPFQVTLFDASAILLAPDSVAVLNNQVYCLTSQGVIAVTDTGVSVISRPIEDQLLAITREGFNYKQPTFGVAYESERAYLLFTIREETDTVATQVLRFNTFTRTWTRWLINKTCGRVVNVVRNNATRVDDRMYLGPDDENFIERERKRRNRTDFADRDLLYQIITGGVNGTTVTLGSIQGIQLGDVLLQTQTVTIAQFNRLLRKLDTDPTVADNNYEALLTLSPGQNIVNKLIELGTKLDADSGVVGTGYNAIASNSSVSLQIRFNTILSTLDLDAGVFYQNYFSTCESSGSIEYEGVVSHIDANNVTVTTPTALPFLDGEARIYKSIRTDLVWSPASFGDVSLFKQVSEGTAIFEDNNFSTAELAYSTDLSPGFEAINFSGKGNGNWGIFNYGGLNWGGVSSATPLRTYIPRQKQRCRFMVVRFRHNNAREKYSLYGVSLTFRPYSTRAYR